MVQYSAKKVFTYFLLLFSLDHRSYADNFIDSTDAIVPTVPPSGVASLVSKKSDDTKTLLFLSIFINQAAYKDLIAVKQDRAGKLYIRADDLRLLRLLINSSIADNELIPLDSIEGISFSYSPNEQSLFIKASPDQLSTYTLDLETNNISKNFGNINTINALILNYNIYTNYFSHHYALTSNQDITYSTNSGNLNTGFLYSNSAKDSQFQHFIRLDTKWQHINPTKISQYTIGDFNSNTTDWGSSTRLAGFQWSSAYSQRPDIITTAMPNFSGSAVLPSTLDLYVNQQRIFSGNVPAGRFDIKQIPYISGNEVTLVTTDETGHQVIKKEPYYYSAKLLNTEIKEFSVDVGIPRYNYGLLSNNYNTHTILSSGSFRYGYSPLITLSGGSEVSTDGLINLGMGGITKFLGRSVFNTSIAMSHYKNNFGGLAQVGIDSQISQTMVFNTSYQETLNKYANLAYVSEQKYQKNTDSFKSTAFAQKILRAGISYSPIPNYSLTLGYNQISSDNSINQLLSMNLNGNMSQNWSFYLSGYTGLTKKNNSAFLAVRYSPSMRFNATTSTTLNDHTVSYRQEFSGSNISNNKIGSFSGGGAIESNGASYDSSLYSSYMGNYNTIAGTYTENNSNRQVAVSLSGSVIAASRKIFFANQIGNGFAIVNNAGPKSQVLNGGVNLGQTDAKGKFLITNLNPYQTQFIYIDPTNLPLDWSLNSTEKSTIIGYKQGVNLDFGAHESAKGLIKIIDKSGRVIAPGYAVLVNGKDSAIVGYDGQVFLENIQKNNILIVDLLDKGECTIEFPYAKSKKLFNMLGTYMCK
ncbi:fimbria/pilus outer membrane usher protein [Acinetobacter nectaris]|uniref:fimbria/pilus outer membrane usher protein n=1 Tax=Acinetobacter nectaris TaxID=1219382 RepID=UPI001F0041A3|nr:fimbria/pilus outer membrane usher protein [Acinetobacter nectaris]MCF9046971.1 fimbrial biogenesis outer membrane usher protein [Acinetobacter nectaris]